MTVAQTIEIDRNSLPRGEEVRDALTAAAAERILIFDGAYGTMIQRLKLGEADSRGERFKDWHIDVRGNNDLLNLTLPDAIRDIHVQYYLAGADICETNTFSSTAIVMADYGMQALAYELNYEGARIAREAAKIAEAKDGKALKIDKAYVDAIDVSDDGVKVVKALIGLAERFGLFTIAEGVERQSQVDRLLELGCYAGQGGVFDRALPYDDFAGRWLDPVG